jgi:hypothetical protein
MNLVVQCSVSDDIDTVQKFSAVLPGAGDGDVTLTPMFSARCPQGEFGALPP